MADDKDDKQLGKAKASAEKPKPVPPLSKHDQTAVDQAKIKTKTDAGRFAKQRTRRLKKYKDKQA